MNQFFRSIEKESERERLIDCFALSIIFQFILLCFLKKEDLKESERERLIDCFALSIIFQFILLCFLKKKI